MIGMEGLSNVIMSSTVLQKLEALVLYVPADDKVEGTAKPGWAHILLSIFVGDIVVIFRLSMMLADKPVSQASTVVLKKQEVAVFLSPVVPVHKKTLDTQPVLILAELRDCQIIEQGVDFAGREAQSFRHGKWVKGGDKRQKLRESGELRELMQTNWVWKTAHFICQNSQLQACKCMPKVILWVVKSAAFNASLTATWSKLEVYNLSVVLQVKWQAV
jgi:hypothetical protein